MTKAERIHLKRLEALRLKDNLSPEGWYRLRVLLAKRDAEESEDQGYEDVSIQVIQ